MNKNFSHFTPLRLAILGSGKGSNARALIEASKKSGCCYEPVVVISDNEEAKILTLAREWKIPAHFVPPGPFKTIFSKESEQQLISLLQAFHVDVVALAGFMRVIKEPLLRAFPERILNIHPSLLPAFPGLEAWKQAVSAKVRESGCTVHLVDQGIDTGKILGQTRVPVFHNDTAESLHVRIQEAEHELYPRMVHAFTKMILNLEHFEI